MHHLTTYKEQNVQQTSGSTYLKLHNCLNAESQISRFLTDLQKTLQVLHDGLWIMNESCGGEIKYFPSISLDHF